MFGSLSLPCSPCTLQVVASPMVRLTNKLELPIEEIGTPERIIAALGPFVTGDSYDPDEVVDTRIRKEGDQTQFLLVPFRVDLPAITGNLRFLRCQHSIGQFRCSMKCWLVIMWQPCGAGGLRGFLHRWLCWQALMLPFPPIQSLLFLFLLFLSPSLSPRFLLRFLVCTNTWRHQHQKRRAVRNRTHRERRRTSSCLAEHIDPVQRDPQRMLRDGRRPRGNSHRRRRPLDDA
ncbi:unnamed protein product [Closterium sp. NIES-53]